MKINAETIELTTTISALIEAKASKLPKAITSRLIIATIATNHTNPDFAVNKVRRWDLRETIIGLVTWEDTNEGNNWADVYNYWENPKYIWQTTHFQMTGET